MFAKNERKKETKRKKDSQEEHMYISFFVCILCVSDLALGLQILNCMFKPKGIVCTHQSPHFCSQLFILLIERVSKGQRDNPLRGDSFTSPITAIIGK